MAIEEPETMTVCSNCSSGVSNDDWTSLDFHYSSEKSDKMHKRILGNLQTLGYICHHSDIEDPENYGPDFETCEVCEEQIGGGYSLWVKG